MKKILVWALALCALPLFSFAQVQSTCTFNAPLALGSRGEEVIRLQNVLIGKGLLASDSNTGYYGLMTQAAVAQLQLANNLEGVGSIGPLTRVLITKLCEAPQTAPTTPVAPNIPSTTSTVPTTSTTPKTPKVPKTTGPVVPYTTPVPADASIQTKVAAFDYSPEATRKVFTSKNTSYGDKPVPLSPRDTDELDLAEHAEALEAADEYNIGLTADGTPAAVQACSTGPFRGDLDADTKVGLDDLLVVSRYYNQQVPPDYPSADINNDSKVGFDELLAVAQDYGKYECVLPVPGTFKIFDATGGYVGQPVPVTDVMEPVTVGWYGHFFAGNYPVYDTRRGDKTATQNYARTVTTKKLVIDIELSSWPYDLHVPGVTTERVNETISKFNEIIGWIREVRPDLEVGVYSHAPVSNYWGAHDYELGLDAMNKLNAGEPYSDYLAWARSGVAKPSDPNDWSRPWVIDPNARWTKEYLKWQVNNDLMRGLADKLDFISPQIYTPQTGTDGLEGWKRMAKHNILEAKRYGKPVYAFIWPRYFYRPNAWLPKSHIRQQLDLIKQVGADGVMVWDGGEGASWNEPAWVDAVEEFAAANGIASTQGASAFTAVENGEMVPVLRLYGAIVAILVFYLLTRALYWKTRCKCKKETPQQPTV
jgi:peptidoglycan hydrolase-like protein with peptidoglycan-binding domain